MKKITALLLALLIVLSLCACGDNTTPQQASDGDTSASQKAGDTPATPQEDLIAVEDIEYGESGGRCWARIKARNMTDERIGRFSVCVQVIDKNGDILGSQDLDIEDTEPGQAAFSEDMVVIDCDFAEATGFRVLKYEILTPRPEGGYTYGTEYYLSEPWEYEIG